MSAVLHVMIVLPAIILILIAFVFSNSTTAITQHQTIMNCPFPINAGIANLTAIQKPPQINYTQSFDSNTDVYHVTTFKCEFAPTSQGASINTRVYTADVSNPWFAMTNRSSGYLFYISEIFDTIGIRLNAFGNMIWALFTTPAQVTGLEWFTYAQLFMFSMIAVGLFMVVR